ncbi:14158_t:CDS:2, partial [Cetraspora pellucida]
MDYSTVFKNLAKEAGVSIPSSAFSKPILSRQSTTSTTIKVSKCAKCGEPRSAIGWFDCYGVSKDPNTGSYVTVMRYAEQGNLRHYLSNYFTDLTWDEKIVLFDRIGKALKGIHDSGGNILRHEKLVYITDLGMCRPVNESKDSKSYGVLPYVAPEVLRGDPYTEAADIYSLGMIMWEMSSNEPPFSDRAHDYKLAREICLGLRPPIISGTPKGYVAAMLRCWDCDQSKRPTIDELLNVSYKWRYLSDGKAPFQGPKTKKVKTGSVKSVLTNSNTVHPQAFYTSRLLHYPNLPEPRNSDHYTLFDSTTGEIHTIVRKQHSKKDSDRSSFVPDELSSFAPSEKGKEKAKEEFRPRSSRRESITRSMTTSKIDKGTIERIRSELSHYRWNSTINDIPRQVELLTID